MAVHKSPVLETAPRLAKRTVSVAGQSLKTVLFVTNTIEFGGAERHLLELIRRLTEPGIQVSILCLGEDFFTQRLGAESEVRITREEMPGSLSGWVKIFRAAQPEVVVFIYGFAGSFPWLAPVGARLARVPRRFSIQHLAPLKSAEPSLVSRLARLMFGRVKSKVASRTFHATICVSNALRKSLVTEFGFPEKTLRTIHNGVALAEFVPGKSGEAGVRMALRFGPEEFVLVCAARLNEQKGIDILLKAIARVARDGINFKCVIVGDGPLREQLLEQARELSLLDDVFFEGFQEDVRPYLQAASAFVLTSYWEGLPLAILEAMACGLPCIVTDVGGNAEAVADRENGLVVAPGSVDDVADAISYLATHADERARMSQAARATVREAFDIDGTMAKIREVILS